MRLSGGAASRICSNAASTAISNSARNLGALYEDAGVAHGTFQRGGVWWYKFHFAGQLIRESSKSTSKTVAKEAEKERRRELEAGYNSIKDVCQQRVRSLEDIIDEYLVGYRLRYRSATFANYALGHVSRLLATNLVVDVDEATVLGYQESRLREKAAPKTINGEVRLLLKMLGDPGELIRGRLRKKKQLKLLSDDTSARSSIVKRQNDDR